jgi:hypothetical protein
VVVVNVGDRQVLQALAPVAVVGQHVVKKLEDIDAVVWTMIYVDEHVLAVRQPDEGAVTLSHIRENDLELSHVGSSHCKWIELLD